MTDAPNHTVSANNGVVENDFTLAESMRKPQYWMLAVMFLTACMSGLYVIGVAKDVPENGASRCGDGSQRGDGDFHR